MIFTYITYLLYIFYIYIYNTSIHDIYKHPIQKEKMNNWVPQFFQISYILLTLDCFCMLLNSE